MISPASPRSELARCRRIVIKVGSSLLHESPVALPAQLADDVEALADDSDIQSVIVSSGAVSLGCRRLDWTPRPSSLPMLQAAAAIGQGQLLQNWEHAFSAHQRLIGQILLTHDDISNRQRFMSARHVLFELLASNVIPIINENDTVAVEEIKFGDNDLLAALVANLVAADLLIILTDVDGLHDGDPASGGRRVSVVDDIGKQAAPLAGGASSGHGSGGMTSKVQAARSATRHGVPTAVASGRMHHVVTRLIAGEDLGTLFVPNEDIVSSHTHWIAYGSRPRGHVVVSAAAHAALRQGATSLLPNGVIEVEGPFEQGDVISLVTEAKAEFARGLAGYSAADMERIIAQQSADIEATLGYKYLDELIHCDDLALL